MATQIIVIEEHDLPTLPPLRFLERGEENHYFKDDKTGIVYCLKTNH